jgi:UrcA family protein
MISKPLTATLGALVLAGAFIPGAHAVESVVVRYSELAVASPAGASALYHRIQRAASTVCPDYPSGDVRHIRIWRPCYNDALATAVATIDMPEVTALYLHQTRAQLASVPAVTKVNAPAREE